MKDCMGHDFELFRISRGELALLLPTRIHLLSCPACRSRVAELRSVSNLLAETISTTTVRQPFRRLSTPMVASIFACGIFALGSLVNQTGIGAGSAPAKETTGIGAPIEIPKGKACYPNVIPVKARKKGRASRQIPVDEVSTKQIGIR